MSNSPKMFAVSLYDTWEIYIKLCDLRYNIDELVNTDEVNMVQKTRLREYARMLRRRTNKLEAVMKAERRIEETKFIPLTRPMSVEIGDAC